MSSATGDDNAATSDTNAAFENIEKSENSVDRIKTLIENSVGSEINVQVADVIFLLGQLEEACANNDYLTRALVDIKTRLSAHNGALVDQLIERFGVTGLQKYM
jgi:hypothetical protein